MTVTNSMLLAELKRIQSRVDELAAAIVDCGARAVALEVWRNGHDKNVHTHLSKQIEAAQRTQERQSDRLWKVALQVAQIATMLAAITKMTGMW